MILFFQQNIYIFWNVSTVYLDELGEFIKKTAYLRAVTVTNNLTIIVRIYSEDSFPP